MDDLWIGPPGLMRPMPERSDALARPRTLGAAEFVSLEGAVTVSRARRAPRRTTLSWASLRPDDFDTLTELVTAPPVWGIGNPGHGHEVALVEPMVRNHLSGAQSRGRVSDPTKPGSWVQDYALTGGMAGADYGQTGDGVMNLVVTGVVAQGVITYLHPRWPGYPVNPGWPVTLMGDASTQSLSVWRHCVPRLTWISGFGDAIATVTGTVGTAATPAQVTGVAPDQAAYVVPSASVVTVPAASMLLGSPTVLAYTTPDQVQGWPLGEGCPAYAITSFDDAPTPTGRGITLSLVEVRADAVR